MSIEARLPPAQYGLRLKRMLGGKAGWNGVILQILFVAVLVWVGYEIVANARSNLAAQRITSGFGFLNNTEDWGRLFIFDLYVRSCGISFFVII